MANTVKQVVVATLVASLATACVDSVSGPDESALTDPPPPSTNGPPTISGTPAISVTRDQLYEFTPSASDPDGDQLTYSITNLPEWASFVEASGTLAGTPTDMHVGVTEDVMITVSDGELTASLGPFAIEVLQLALGTATVFWDIPSSNADGSPLLDLAGFEVHYGAMSENYTAMTQINDPAANSAAIDELTPGVYFFAVLAVDDSGNKSALSAEVSKDVQP